MNTIEFLKRLHQESVMRSFPDRYWEDYQERKAILMEEGGHSEDTAINLAAREITSRITGENRQCQHKF